MKTVVVVGAGMAGLAAARVVAEAGGAVVVLEAGSRVGGRVRTVRAADGSVVELGAEFIHGRPAELEALIAEAGLTMYERTGSFLVSREGELDEQDWQGGEEEDGPLERLKGYAGADMSFAVYLDGLGLDEDERRQHTRYVEGFNAADAREASVLALGRQQVAEDAIDGERLRKIHGGYAQLPEYLAGALRQAGGRIEFGASVVEVSDDGVGGLMVGCADGRRFPAGHVVVAVPLGVLKAGEMRLPAAADGVLGAAGAMRMGPVCRVTMLFRRRIWPATMSFLLASGGEPAVWWSDHPGNQRLLTGWTGGPRALGLLTLTPEELRRRMVRGLAAALGVEVAEVAAEVEEFHFFDWQADPVTQGSYSWVPVGALEASGRMSVPVVLRGGATIAFAGEHTDTTGLWGTVHAAYGSGLRAGRAVVKAMGVANGE